MAESLVRILDEANKVMVVTSKIGAPGTPGIDGLNGFNGLNGIDGIDGRSAYQLWLNAGNVGTETDYFVSLKGDKGDVGDTGPSGGAYASTIVEAVDMAISLAIGETIIVHEEGRGGVFVVVTGANANGGNIIDIGNNKQIRRILSNRRGAQAEQFGAKPDHSFGVVSSGTDNTPSLDAAILSVKDIQFGRGLYRLASPWLVQRSFSLIEGRGSSAQWQTEPANDSTSLIKDFSGPLIRLTNPDSVNLRARHTTIRNIRLAGQYNAGPLIYSNNAADLILNDVALIDSGGHGVELYSGQDTRIQHSVIRRTGTLAPTLSAAIRHYQDEAESNIVINSLFILDCTLEENEGNAIWITGKPNSLVGNYARVMYISNCKLHGKHVRTDIPDPEPTALLRVERARLLTVTDCIFLVRMVGR